MSFLWFRHIKRINDENKQGWICTRFAQNFICIKCWRLLGFGPDIMIDAEQAKNITKTFFEQHHGITNIRADLNGGTWKVLVDTFHKQIEVLLNAEDGRILGFSFLKGE